MDRRITFFLIAAVISLLLLPLSPPEFRIVCEVVAGVYVVLAFAVVLDQWSRRHDERARLRDFARERERERAREREQEPGGERQPERQHQDQR